MKSTLFILLLFLGVSFGLHGQTTTDLNHETNSLIGINITNTLAGFFNSGGQNIPKDPYLFSYKRLKDDKIWRFGGNFSVEKSTENEQFGSQLNVQESLLRIRAGREWIQPVSKSFSIYYGVDLVGNYSYEKSSFEFQSDLISKDYLTGLGTGPFFGVYFMLGKRVWLSTEAYAYGIYYFGKSTVEIGGGVPAQNKETRKISFVPAIPNSLYAHFSF